MARPTSYSEALGAEIAERIAEGGSLKVLAQSRTMPSLRTMLRWTAEHPEFDRMLAHARTDKSHVLMEESIEISDEPVADMAQATRNRLRVQARQYAAARLNPAKYAEKIGIGQAPELPPVQGQLSEYDAARRFLFAMNRVVHILEQDPPQAPRTRIEAAKR